MRLNVGCGTDRWGEVRLDVNKKYLGRRTSLHVLADAENLPFRDKSFTAVRARHVLEHLPHWKKAINEWCRVTRKWLEIEVPADVGYLKSEIYLELFSLNLQGIFRLPQRRKQHLWKFTPQAIMKALKDNQFDAKLQVIWDPLFFRDLNRLSKMKFVRWIRGKQRGTVKFGYRILGRAHEN